MPTVLRVGGFRVIIFLPPREHEPPHVHVRNADGEVVILLARPGHGQEIRDAAGMRTRDVVAAYRMIEDHTEYLLQRWREFHDT